MVGSIAENDSIMKLPVIKKKQTIELSPHKNRRNNVSNLNQDTYGSLKKSPYESIV